MNTETNGNSVTEKRVHQPDEVTFMYFGMVVPEDKDVSPYMTTRTRSNPGVVCIAIKQETGASPLRIGMSFCSPRDHFIKKKGRLIATNRCESTDRRAEGIHGCIVIPVFTPPEGEDYPYVADQIISYLSTCDRSTFPRWVHDLQFCDDPVLV